MRFQPGAQACDGKARRSDDLPAPPVVHQLASQSVLKHLSRLDSQHDIRRQVGLAGDKITDDVVTQHLFVHRVGFDVLVEEDSASWVRSQAFQSLRHALGIGRSADLGRGEVSDQRPAQRPMQPNNNIMFTVASVTAGTMSRYRPYRASSPTPSIRSANSRECIRSARPPPNSSNSTATSDAFA
jgi:hypothetical protein